MIGYNAYAQGSSSQVNLTPSLIALGSVSMETSSKAVAYLYNERDADILVTQCTGQQDIVIIQCPGGVVKSHSKALIEFVFAPREEGKVDKTITVKYQEYIPKIIRPGEPLSRQDKGPPKLSDKVYEIDLRITGEVTGIHPTPAPAGRP
ncbi:MAG: hypothetical protein ABII18_11780 [bacterium]|nr:hypothetical protein [bacterium]MBU1917558.1 hypothetical protein [bacterium]